MPPIRWDARGSWRLDQLPASRVAESGVFAALLSPGALDLDGVWRARPRSPRRDARPGPLEFEAAAGRVVLARHPSGAWSVHLPVDRRRQFAIEVPVAALGARRGLGAPLRVFVLRAAAAWPRAVRAFELRLWRSAGSPPGLVAVTRQGLGTGQLALAPRIERRPPGRRLLFVHGTFSSTAHAFAALGRGPAAARFWRFAEAHYPGGVYGFDHPTLGADPLANARALLAALGPGPLDAVSHSRGGLVLRSLVESLARERAAVGLEFGHAVLAAAPNEGTPLAAPARRTELIALLLNLAEELSPGALGFGVPFAAAALAWLARGVAVALPGLTAMQPDGAFLAALNGPPAPPQDAYAALCAHTRIEGGLLARFADAGLGALFAQPHDLVVPTAGSWRVDAVGVPAIAADRVACFGPGGNLPGRAHHFDLFAHEQTADILERALSGTPLGLATTTEIGEGAARQRGGGGPASPASIERGGHLSSGGSAKQGTGSSRTDAPPRVSRGNSATRGAASAVGVGGSAARRSSGGRPRLPPRADALSQPRLGAGPGLDLFVIGSEAGAADALLLACYRGARVLEPFARRGPRWQRIVAGHRRLRAAASGLAEPPTQAALRALGSDLFETLLPGDARRLYDEARGAEPRLPVFVTSTLDWVADAPWELCFDPRRQTFLAASEAHLFRGVYSAVPVERPRRRQGRLRVLVATASPRGLTPLSLAGEERALRAALAPGALAGRVVLEVLAHATPQALAERLETAAWDVLHFVGHGEHDVRGRAPGRLVFEDERGGPRLLDATAVRALVAGRGLSLVFVNACESGLHGPGDLARGVAPELARAGVEAVVAHQSSVLDASALCFARVFYEALARGRDLGGAAAEARTALRVAASGEGYDWATPVVFLRG